MFKIDKEEFISYIKEKQKNCFYVTTFDYISQEYGFNFDQEKCLLLVSYKFNTKDKLTHEFYLPEHLPKITVEDKISYNFPDCFYYYFDDEYIPFENTVLASLLFEYDVKIQCNISKTLFNRPRLDNLC